MGKENEIKTVVPTLRFPEFVHSWYKHSLGDISTFYKGKGLSKSSIIINGKFSCIHYGELFTEYAEVIRKIKSKTNERDGFLSKENDVLMPMSDVTPNGLAKASCIKINDVLLGGDILIIRTKKSNIYGEFLSRYLRLKKRDILRIVNGTTIFHLSLNSLSKLLLFIPTLPEQKRIADCLSSLDELIEATAQKVETLKEHKKGLMQRLFPAKGKNVPDLRFPEFQGMKGWEKKQVKDFGEVITGNTPSKKEGKYWNGDFVWVTAQDFKGKYINDSILKLTKFGKDKARVIPKDSVLVTCIASIGLNAINKVECSTNQQINTICCNKEYYYEYVYYLVTYNTKNLKQLAGQTAVPIITKKSFEEFEVYAIDNYDEQQKIADCLSSLDELIEVISRKVEILKEYKKGLMQQLFPRI